MPTLRRRLGWSRRLLRAMGPAQFASYQAARLAGREIAVAAPREAAYPLRVRTGTSDGDVLLQVFALREYAPLAGLTDVGLVLDCGANVGYSAAWFLTQFPSARVVCVEPERGNVTALERNLAPYGERAKVVHAGLWPRDAPLVVERGGYRDGRDWATQVRSAREGETGDVRGVSIPSLLDGSPHDRISILKMDIEGAEAEIFRGPTGWLDRVDAFAVELHDDSAFGEASGPFQRAITAHDFEVSRSGELTLGVRRR